MKSIYRELKDTYKKFESNNPIGDIWCIPQYDFKL